MHPHRSTNNHQESSRSRRRAVLVGSLFGALLLALASGGCQTSRLTDGMPDNSERCTSCHGTPGNPAPPYALNGSWDTNYVGVGAHQQHLIGGAIAGPVPCYECHPIPTELLTHPNWSGQPTAVTFGPMATLTQPTPAPAAPAWDRASARCSNVYCHGATLSGAASRSAPIWTRVDGSQRRCTSCHGYPPTGTTEAPHSTSTDCVPCHGVVSGPGQTIVNPLLHVNGVIDIGGPPTSAASNARSAGIETEGVAW